MFYFLNALVVKGESQRSCHAEKDLNETVVLLLRFPRMKHQNTVNVMIINNRDRERCFDTGLCRCRRQREQLSGLGR